jgi:hypothetical protein
MKSLKILAIMALTSIFSLSTALAADNGNNQNYAPSHKNAAKHGYGGSANSTSSKLQPYDGSSAPHSSQ